MLTAGQIGGRTGGIKHGRPLNFGRIAAAGNTNLTTVAPAIAEALFATAIGLFVAIPAVWAYNRFTTRVERLSVRYESFAEEFSSILQRQSAGDE